MVMRVMTLMHMFEMTLALGLGTSLVTLWRVWTPLQYMQTAQHNRPPWSCEIRGLRDADELIVLGFFLKVSHFTFRMIFSLARNLSSCCPTEVSSCRFVGKTTPLAVRMQYSYGIMHMHILAAFQCTELTSPQYICFDAPRLLQQSFFNGHWTTMMRRAPRPLREVRRCDQTPIKTTGAAATAADEDEELCAIRDEELCAWSSLRCFPSL
jgi:hypothetical protein